MSDYQSLRIDLSPCSETITDLLASYLADIGYESFVPDDTGLTAYIKASDFSLPAVEDILAEFPMEIEATVSDEFVAGRDWNQEWEQNYFKPIVVGGRCVVHASFHNDVPKAELDIVIDPKMAFGTGHHATTSLIIEYLLDFPLKNKKVIDMGTGTGILAIVCRMCGAESVTGIEIDEGAWQNAVENTALNNVADIKMIHGDAGALKPFCLCDSSADMRADLLIANINRNIILADVCDYAAALRRGGTMILSGFYTEDAQMLIDAGKEYDLEKVSIKQRDNWCALMLCKESEK